MQEIRIQEIEGVRIGQAENRDAATGCTVVLCPEGAAAGLDVRGGGPASRDMNVLSMHALIGAYKPEGYEWCDELCEVLSGNVNYAVDYIARHFDGVEVSKPEGTYMLFVDCTRWCEAHGKTIDELEKALWSVGVAVQDGRMFHGPCHIRMNLASPLSRIQEAFALMDRYVFNAEA